MIFIFLVLVVGIVLAFVFRDTVKQEVSTILQENLITTYQDDPDKQSTIDWIQENVSTIHLRNYFHEWLSKEYRD